MARAKKKTPGITGGIGLPTTLDFIKYVTAKKKRDRKNSFYNMVVGQRGDGKTYSGIELAKQFKKENPDIITVDDAGDKIAEVFSKMPTTAEVLERMNKSDTIRKKMEELEEYEKKYQPKVAKISDAEMAEFWKPTATQYGNSLFVASGGGGGGSNGNNNPTIYLNPPYQQQPRSPTLWEQQQQAVAQSNWQQSGWWSTTAPISDGSASQTVKEPEQKKKQYTAEDLKGKICAVVTLRMGYGVDIVEHTGVLFVKKCGHWKLLGFNGSQLAGGSSGFEDELKKETIKIIIHQILYKSEEPAEPIGEEAVEPIGEDELEIL